MAITFGILTVIALVSFAIAFMGGSQKLDSIQTQMVGKIALVGILASAGMIGLIAYRLFDIFLSP